MANQSTNDSTTQASTAKPKMSYFRTKLAGMRVYTGKKDARVESARFSIFEERENGDPVRVGYLETDNEAVVKELENDVNVESIDKDEFEKATGEKSKPVGY